MTDKTDIEALRDAALKATTLNLNTAQLVRDNSDKQHECPLCEGNGTVDGDVDYCNIDGVALGVQFYGIGPEHGLAESYFRAANPASIIALLDQLEAERQRANESGERFYKAVQYGAKLEAELAALRGEQEPVAYMTSDKRMIIFADSTNMLPEDRSILTPLFTTSKTPTPSECLSCDRHYVDGLKHGWNLRDSDNNQGFIDAIERVQKDIRGASSEAAGIVVKDGE